MMIRLSKYIIVLCSIWYLNATSLPKLYYRLQGRRNVAVQQLRKLEKSGLKLTKLTLDLKYFQSCVELGLCPKFLRFKPPNLSAYKKTSNVYRQVLINQVNIIKKELKSIRNTYIKELKSIRNSISYMESLVLCNLLKKRYVASSVPVLKTHNKKLLALWKSERTRSPDCLMNLSSVKLSLLEQNVLRLGLKSHILPKKIDEEGVKVEIEKLVSNITNEYNVVISSGFKEKLRSLCKSFVSEANGVCSNKQNQLFHRTIKSLSANKEIKVCKYDKGNGVVVLNCIDYFNKLDTIVLDKSKFEEIVVNPDQTHPVISNENRIKRYIYNHVKKCVDESVCSEITPSGSQPGKLYGLCKVHKDGNPMRPVISMVGTAEYHLAKYLDTFIKPNINTLHSVNSTSAFIEKLDEFQFSDGDQLVSYDVSSLYTNVPLDESIELISNKIYSSDSLARPPFPKTVFVKLLKFSTSGLFMYKNSLFRQVDGVAMGSPLGPSIANFFLGHLEENKLFTNGNINPKLYVRYVDDIFAVFGKNESFQPFLNHINSQHPNIKFTVEESVNNVLPFLDTCIELKGDYFESFVYRKKTNTNVLLNAEATCPANWKRSVIFGAINRAKMICKSHHLFLKEVSKLKSIFASNGYSNVFFDRVYKSFTLRNEKNSSDKQEVNFRHMLKIPFVGQVSHGFKSKIMKLFLNELRIEICPIFSTVKVSNFFSLKSKTPKQITSNVVYKFTCLCDASLTYIGKTKRHFGVRSLEHLDFMKVNPVSEVKSHVKSCDVCKNCSLENFKIMKKCRSDRDAKIHEAMFIKKELPKLNLNLYNKGSLVTLYIFY